MPNVDDLIRSALETPNTGIDFVLNQRMAEAFPGQHVMRTEDPSFDLDTWAKRTQTKPAMAESSLPVLDHRWTGLPRNRVGYRFLTGHREVTWSGTSFHVIQATWPGGIRGDSRVQFWIGPTREQVEAFAAQVAAVANEVEDEVLVFNGYCWDRDAELRSAISTTTFESLVQPEGAAETLLADFRGFLEARSEYERYQVPWKRGALLLGPPGNGKTHAVKALINALELPCFYVRSFGPEHSDPQEGVGEVFARVRKTTPCALVLEDLDSLVTDATRSYFLNELDGFADNAGIVTIATTNHPERLDTAIVDRPSRFDRKYHFELPAEPERVAYLTWWRGRLVEEVSLGEPAIARAANATDGFSYAYLKELVLSSLVAWMSGGRTQSFDACVEAQVAPLRAQLQTPAG